MIKEVHTDILVIGTGISGLYFSIGIPDNLKISLISKTNIKENNSSLANCGIAVALGENYSGELHINDTLRACCGLSDPEAVKRLIESAQTEIGNLVKLNIKFEKKDELLALEQENGHSRNRLIHSAEDRIGSEIENILYDSVKKHDNITIYENHFAVDLIVTNNICYGAVCYNETNNEFTVFYSKAVILSTGGSGQLFLYTTNSSVSTGDGLSMAFKAGACLTDIEFIQFYPTALHNPNIPPSESMYPITDLLRTSGAILVNIDGEAFMLKYHPKAELAPRDIITRAIYEEMIKTKYPFVFLNVSRVNNFQKKFSKIYEKCLNQKIDLSENQIPVSPAAHYMIGGIKTDISGKTNISGLYAIGECGSSGVHGANRLFGNSLLECIVFSKNASEDVIKNMDNTRKTNDLMQTESVKADNIPVSRINLNTFNSYLIKNETKLDDLRSKLQETMWSKSGIMRNEANLKKASQKIDLFLKSLSKFESKMLGKTNKKELISRTKKKKTTAVKKYFELKNMLLTAKLITEAAIARNESRGVHYRSDYPVSNDRIWLKHLTFQEIPALKELNFLL